MSSDDHLDSNRIRQMAALRRAAIRTRSYCVIALCGCIVAAAELIFDAIRDWPSPFRFRAIWPPLIYLICTILLLIAAVYFLRLALGYHREAKQTAIPPPTTPPDFSQLQDGSQIARNLEEMNLD
jgi:hypothetical protein